MDGVEGIEDGGATAVVEEGEDDGVVSGLPGPIPWAGRERMSRRGSRWPSICSWVDLAVARHGQRRRRHGGHRERGRSRCGAMRRGGPPSPAGHGQERVGGGMGAASSAAWRQYRRHCGGEREGKGTREKPPGIF